MPEIWLNYGQNEVFLDIQQENLNEKPLDENQTLDESKIDEKLDGLDLSKPVELEPVKEEKKGFFDWLFALFG